jgi:ribosomal protein S18 acetylase RimI-like enzyme
MSVAEHDDLMARLLPGYAASHVTAGTWNPEEAEQKAAAELAGLLPAGLSTKDMVFLTAEDAGRVVGSVWLALNKPRPAEAFIYYIEVAETERNKGYGRALLAAAEAEAAARGMRSLGLNVFGENATARRLYEAAGYETMSLQMKKELAP